jgi:hypothetical protein
LRFIRVDHLFQPISDHQYDESAAIIRTPDWNYFQHFFRPERGTWSKGAAESILRFDFPPADSRRMNSLAAKSRKGSLSAAEETELEHYREVGRLLELLQSKARLSLKRLASE